jgi:hypothetical protein
MYWHSPSEHVIDGLELHMLHQSQTDKSIAGHPARLYRIKRWRRRDRTVHRVRHFVSRPMLPIINTVESLLFRLFPASSEDMGAGERTCKITCAGEQSGESASDEGSHSDKVMALEVNMVL